MKIPFSEVFADETKNGTKLKTSDYQTSGTYPIIDQGQEFIAGYTDSENGLYTDVPAIIFGDHTRVLKYVDFPFFLGADGAKILKARKAHANYRYLYYALKSVRIPDTGYNRHFKWLKEATVSIPDFQNQEYIVFTLDSISRIISHRKSQLAKLDEFVKCRFFEMFGYQKTNPRKWPTARIGTCCTLKSGTSLPAEKENEGGPIPYVKVGDMNYLGNEYYITTSSRFVSEHTAGAGIFPIGTVIFPKRGGAIGTNKKRLTSLPICADLNVMGVTAGAKLEPLYLFAYFNSIDLGALGGGSSIPQINNKDIVPLIICLPPIALQKQFTSFVRRIDKLRIVIRQSLDEAQKLFDSLMQEYFD